MRPPAPARQPARILKFSFILHFTNFLSCCTSVVPFSFLMSACLCLCLYVFLSVFLCLYFFMSFFMSFCMSSFFVFPYSTMKTRGEECKGINQRFKAAKNQTYVFILCLSLFHNENQRRGMQGFHCAIDINLEEKKDSIQEEIDACAKAPKKETLFHCFFFFFLFFFSTESHGLFYFPIL